MTRSRELAKILTDGNLTGTLDVAGIATANAGVKVDNITIDGTEIDLSSGDLTIDVAGNIRLDANDNGEIRLLDGGTQYGALKIDSNRFKIQSIVNDADMMFAGIDNGSEITALTLDMSDAGTAIFGHDVKLTDNAKLQLGASQDLQIYHNSTSGNSFIADEGTGGIILSSGSFLFQNQARNETHATMTVNGAVELYYDNSKKFETTSSGATLTGNLTITDGHVRSGVTHTYNLYGSTGTGGSANYVTYSFVGDPNTGMYSGTADTVKFATGGGERMRITSGGNVAIGMSSPASKFVIYDSANPYIYLQNSTTGTTVNDGFSIIEYGTDAYINNRESGNMLFYNNNAEKMRITSGGLVGINSSNPYSMLDVTSNTSGNTTITASANIVHANNYHDFALGNREAYAVGIRRKLQQSTPAYLRPKLEFFVQNYNTYLPSGRVVRMAIDDFGNILFGGAITNGNGGIGLTINYNSGYPFLNHNHNLVGGLKTNSFKYQGSERGSIVVSTSATSFNTSSDYRLKENVTYEFDATTRLKKLKPARFNWISDDSNTFVDGFLAHEVSSIVPEAITGEKDGTEKYTDNDGKEQTRLAYQSIDQSKLIPLLVKTIQELEARITTLENA